jgi:hypothetical protein
VGWQPIETAPRDGAPILGYADCSFAVVEWYKAGGYWSLSEAGSYAEDSEWHPTHWTPLPKPPSQPPR